MASDAKPLVLIGCTPFSGHMMPLRVIAKTLVERGYTVTFVSASKHQKWLEDAGCNFVPINGYGDWTDESLDTRFSAREKLPPGPAQLGWDIENIFLKSIPSQHDALQVAMKNMTAKHPGKPIVQLIEGAFWGGIPITSGARGIKPTGSIGIGIIPMVLSSIDCAPFGPGIPFDNSPDGRARNKAMKEQMIPMFAPLEKVFRETTQETGAKINCQLLDSVYVLPDRFLQMCSPSVEYPRSDAPSSIRFAGGLPKGKRDFHDPPAFWNEIVNNNGKKIVAVSQGSLALNYSELIVPTLEAFKDRDDILVVVALGRKGNKLPENTFVPANVRVGDFIPFDDLLPHCSVFVSNGGYGAFQHSISHGIPMVLGGESEDKAEVCARAEWVGIGVNLKTQKPTSEAIRNAVDEVLGNSKYKTRAKELEDEMAAFDPLSVVAKTIDELATGTAQK
ncbi:UDP-glucosyltransferase A1 [Lachnellula suecica]|uniref:UDP-glucosyltransferase A1 n=1 Tax=Lachnellula suecica TaxID=602035 RepID=A0A8T9C9C0_9HELO|nr:UDP-glucosyltransferase A1 [Lachnellula suecica]